jgi:hypothetical protein
MKTTAFWEWLRDWISLKILRESPRQPIYWVLISVYLSRALYVAAKLRVADYLLHKPMTGAELARKTKANKASLERLMNSLAAFGYFERTTDDKFAITPAGHALSSFTDGPERDWLLWVGHEANWRGYEYAIECVKQGKSGFELAHGKPIYDFLEEHPEIGECFRTGMNGWSQWQGKEILGAFEFGRFRTIVDVGGGRGGLLAEILGENQGSSGILFDRPDAVELARKDYERKDLSNRCEFVGGSFFESVPRGGDLYILKHILRDWSDEDAADILSPTFGGSAGKFSAEYIGTFEVLEAIAPLCCICSSVSTDGWMKFRRPPWSLSANGSGLWDISSETQTASSTCRASW